MATKFITIQVDPDALRSNPEDQSALIRLGGRKALDDAFDTGYDFTEEEIEAMDDPTYLENQDAIMKAMSKNRILKKGKSLQ